MRGLDPLPRPSERPRGDLLRPWSSAPDASEEGAYTPWEDMGPMACCQAGSRWPSSCSLCHLAPGSRLPSPWSLLPLLLSKLLALALALCEARVARRSLELEGSSPAPVPRARAKREAAAEAAEEAAGRLQPSLMPRGSAGAGHSRRRREDCEA